MVHPVILGPLGPAQLACIRSWARSGFAVGFVHVTEGRSLPLIKGAVTSYLQISPDVLQTEAGIARLHDFLSRHRATGLTCLSYAMARWLNRIKGRLPLETALWVAELDVIDKLESKSMQNRLARSVGLTLLRSFEVSKLAREIIPDDAFPLVLRPDDPTTVSPIFKMQFIEDRTALTAFVARFVRIDRPLIAQPYVRGRNFVVHGYRTRSGESGHQGFLVDRMLDGVTLTLTPAEMPPDLDQKCKQFANKLGLTGIYHFEFLHELESNLYYFLEINGRLGGTTAKAYRCGFDEPGLIPHCYGKEWSTIQHIIAVTATSKQALVKCLLRTFRGDTTIFDYPCGTIKDRLRDLLPGLLFWRDEIIDWRDPRTTIAYFLQKIYGS